MRFYRMVPEVYQVFWRGWRAVSSSPTPPRRLARVASRAPGGRSRPVGAAAAWP